LFTSKNSKHTKAIVSAYKASPFNKRKSTQQLPFVVAENIECALWRRMRKRLFTRNTNTRERQPRFGNTTPNMVWPDSLRARVLLVTHLAQRCH
jgi:hypothetical protein